MDKVTFTPENGEPVDFYVIEQTRIDGVDYLLVSDTAEGDGDAYILKDLSSEEDEESLYEMVSDDAEFEAAADAFDNLLEDIDLVEDEDN